MKKLKFLYKNKLWLASLGLATTGSLVLAACGSNVQPNQSKSDDKKSDKSDSTKPNTDDSTKKDESNSESKKEDAKPKVPTATTEQLAITKSLLSNAEIKTYLTDTVKQAYDLIKENLKEVTEIGAFNRSKITNSIYALDKSKKTSPTASDTDIKTLVDKLKQDVAATDSNVPDDEKTNFNAALEFVTIHAAALLTALEALPADDATNELTALKTAFEKALDDYKSATSADAQTKLTALVTAKNNYQTKLSAVNSLLLTAERKAFALDRATSELAKYINTKVGTFLTAGTKKDQHTTNLNNLVAKVRTDVLGTPGKDLWLENDAPADIATDANKATSTQLYAMVASLAHQIASWNNLNNTFKVFTYNQGLLSELPSALNLLGLHVDVKAPLDVARLNAYLVVDKANIVKLLNDGGDNSIKKVLEKISVGISHYEEVLGKPEGQSNGMAKLVKDLTDLEKAVNSDTAKKGKVTPLKTAAEALVANFAKFQTEWKKLENFLFTDKDATKVYPLLQNANNLNQAIAVSDSYGQVLEVVSQAKKLETVVDGINNNLVAKTGSAPDTVASTLKALVDDITNTTAAAKFGHALTQFLTVTGWATTNVSDRTPNITVQKLAESIAKTSVTGSTTTYSGYIYANGIVKSTLTEAKLSLQDLQTELAKLKLKDSAAKPANQTLGNVKDLLVQQLSPNIDSQTAALNKHLPEMFNNGDVLPETETHF
ncbi:hypothetical protein J2Z62_000417 [Mycoplasmoides fastidiosum]|uniref:Lipoprotein n=1 Tax=Mycoplasmoides fastidiosum TaxID=92758 RepID=A0ABU0LZ47_9BACT|nr:hypothetical protein [Mycoplasmoides fastidiosum]MDQ0513979.1 hypothetical protein [Mycoplasmoides fastidiosum]UUD37607.1 hypothetical protein NPA10_03505 [Mycoplasmoides fastidiosum]